MSDYQMGKELHDYLNRDFTKEVNSWLKIANKLADDRKKKEFNLTLNKSPLQKFSKDKPNQMQKLFNRKIYKAKLDYGFTIAFKGFCLEITARCKYLSENKQSIIKEDSLSLDEILILLDKGLDILTLINFDDLEKAREAIYAYEAYKKAFSDVSSKRSAIIDYSSTHFYEMENHLLSKQQESKA